MKKYYIAITKQLKNGRTAQGIFQGYVTLGHAKREFDLFTKNASWSGWHMELTEFKGYAKGRVPMHETITATEIA